MVSQFKLDAIPFRGKDITCNWLGFCKICKQQKRLWYRGANQINRQKMEVDYMGRHDCPGCVVKFNAHSTVDVYRRMFPYEAINWLYIMGKSTGIDYNKVEAQQSAHQLKEREADEMEDKTKWYLQKHKHLIE
jgi:hypothetical protein